MKKSAAIFLGFLLLTSVNSVSLAQMTRDEAWAKFYDGGIAYKNGEYAQAIKDYESVLEGEKESGAIYFNLGNSYFKNGQEGKAVLNYERALRLNPRDSDILYNYKYVTSTIPSFHSWKGQALLPKLFILIAQSYTRSEWTWGLTFFLFLTFVFHLAGLHLKWRRGIKVMAVGLPLVFVFLSLLFVGVKVHHERNLSVILQDVEARFEPRKDSTTHYSLREGEKVREIKASEGWTKIKRFDGKMGWVSENSLQRI